jgi:hypothetical protein
MGIVVKLRRVWEWESQTTAKALRLPYWYQDEDDETCHVHRPPPPSKCFVEWLGDRAIYYRGPQHFFF